MPKFILKSTKSKRSPAKATDVQLPETGEARSQVIPPSPKEYTFGTWIKFAVCITEMGVLLAYGMQQHDDTLLLVVTVSIMVVCGFGSAAEVLLKYLRMRG